MSSIRTHRLGATLALVPLAMLACKRGATPAREPDDAAAGGRSGASAFAQPAQASPAGVQAPFERLSAALAKTFAAGGKAYRSGKYGIAEQLFHQVVVARADDTAARYQELRAAVRADPAVDLRERLRALLLRDFVAYDHRVHAGKEFAPLWSSPRAGELEAIRAAARDAYAAHLAQGAFFVGRTRPAHPTLYDEAGKSVLDLNEEAYQFDPASGLVRRLSDTGGRVAGIKVDRANKILVMLVVDGLVPSEVDTDSSFSALSAQTLSLDTLEAKGPATLPVEAPVSKVVLCTTAKGDGRWNLGETTYALDPAKRRVLQIGPGDCGPGTAISVTPERGSFLRHIESPGDAGVVELAVDGGSRPVKITDLARSTSIGWSPGHSRLAFARRLDPCSLEPAWPPTGMNTLDVWDPASAKAIRLATAFSYFEWEWLDDDHLVYEGGDRTKGKIVVYDFRTQADVVLDVPSGAGLCAAPSFECIGPAVEPSEDPEE